MRNFVPTLAALALLAIAGFQCSTARAQGTTAFTYQGQLRDGGTNADGSYVLSFSLYDSANGPTNLLGGPITLTNTLVNGLFTVNLDFGSVFAGSARWLDIVVQSGTNTPEELAPRVQILPSPYALYSANAGALSSGSWSAGVGNYQSLTNAFLIFNNGSAVMALTTNAGFIPSLTPIPRIRTFTSNGTFVVPAGVNRIMVEMWGGGGGGGGGGDHTVSGTEYFTTGGGGGAGAYAMSAFGQLNPGDSYTVTVGAAGGGGAFNSSGFNGGTSSLANNSGTLISAGGGGGGAVGITSSGTGGSGGASTGSSFPGGSSSGSPGSLGGFGAPAVRGGSSGVSPGSGGNAGGYPNPGGSGGSGLVIIYY